MNHPASSHRGFTLIELLMVLAIIGVLAAIAMPIYNASVAKSNRSEAKSTLMQLYLDEVERFQDTYSYVNATYTPPTLKYYTITLTASSSAFTATATAKGNQTKDTQCLSLSVNEKGTKSSTPGTTDCWND